MDNDGDPGDEWRGPAPVNEREYRMAPRSSIVVRNEGDDEAILTVQVRPVGAARPVSGVPVLLACDREVLSAALMEHSRALAVFIVGCLDWEKASPTREWQLREACTALARVLTTQVEAREGQ